MYIAKEFNRDSATASDLSLVVFVIHKDALTMILSCRCDHVLPPASYLLPLPPASASCLCLPLRSLGREGFIDKAPQAFQGLAVARIKYL